MERSYQVEAFRLWNSTIDPLGNIDNPPERPTPQRAEIVWKKFFPIFGLVANCKDKEEKYWTDITNFVANVLPSEKKLNPLSDFPSFIIVVFSVRHVLVPRNVDDCVELVTRFRYENIVQFILYELPLLCADPLLFFKTLIELIDDNDSIWTTFIGDPASVEGFVALYMWQLSPLQISENHAIWEHHFLIGEIIYKMLEQSARTHSNIALLVDKFCNALINMLETADPSFEVSAIRWIISLTSLTTKRADNDQVKQRMKSVLTTLNTDSLAFPYFIKYIVDARILKPMTLLRVIPPNTCRNLELIEYIATISDPLEVIPRLIKGSLSCPVAPRMAMQVCKELVVKYQTDQNVKEWMTVCVRRLFIFIALSFGQKKYTNRCISICESLSILSFASIPWLRQAILSAAVAIASTKMVPPFLPLFFQMNATADEFTVSEYESFLHAGINVKFFPFEPNRVALVLPPCSPPLGLPPISAITRQGKRVKGESGPKSGKVRTSCVVKKVKPIIRIPKSAMAAPKKLKPKH